MVRSIILFLFTLLFIFPMQATAAKEKPSVIEDMEGDFIGFIILDTVVLAKNGRFSTFSASPDGLTSNAQNTFNFVTTDCTGQAYANIVGIFDSMLFRQTLLPLDSNNDGKAEWVGFATGPGTSIVIKSRLNAQGVCISVADNVASVSPLFLLDLRQFPTPWTISSP